LTGIIAATNWTLICSKSGTPLSVRSFTELRPIEAHQPRERRLRHPTNMSDPAVPKVLR